MSGSETNMFKDSFQGGFLSILYGIGSKPLQIWSKEVSCAHYNFYFKLDSVFFTRRCSCHDLTVYRCHGRVVISLSTVEPFYCNYHD